MRLRVLRHFALASLLIAPAVARAERGEHVDLVCHATENRALVRFSFTDDANPTYPRLPAALDHGLSANKGSDRTDCTLPDGTTIRVRGGREQAFAYGAGGGNPPAFFSLWINQRKVLSRRVWSPGYGEAIDNPPIYDGLLIAPNRLAVCATAQDAPQHCTSEALDLSKAPIDRVEFAAGPKKAAPAHIGVIAKGAANQRFCAAYLGVLGPTFDSAVRGMPTALDIDLGSLTEQTSLDGVHARSGLLALSPGERRRLVLWENDSHYFDGTVVAVAPAAMTMPDIINAYPIDAIDGWPARAATPGVTLVSGGHSQLYPGVSPRYVHLVPQRVGGALYLFAYPTNNNERPTAALVKPLPDGGFATLCAFNRTEPHY